MFRVLIFLFAVNYSFAAFAGKRPEETFYDDRIINGEDANEGEFPFMASMRKSAPNGLGHVCGASILTSNWVLTAAHCCDAVKNQQFYMYTGSIYLSRGGTKHAVDKVIIHPQYSAANKFRNDICVVRVSEPFKLSNKVTQITLPPQNWPVGGGDKVIVSGWGLTEENGDSVPDRLQKGVNFLTLSENECTLQAGVSANSGYLCVFGAKPGQSAWKGDSGGPLTKNGVQVGLTSFGYAPSLGKPTVFTRVPHFIDWIKEKLGSEASQLKFFK